MNSSKYGLGRGLGALIPNTPPPDNTNFSYAGDETKPPAKTDDFSNPPLHVAEEVDSLEEYSVPAANIPTPKGTPIPVKMAEPIAVPVVEEELVDMSQVISVPTDSVLPNPYQPRKVFDPQSLQELGDSISLHGIIQPLIVTPRPDGKYELIAGERRLQASKLVGLPEVPVIVRRDNISSEQKLEMAIIENVQRSDLNLIEQARAYKKLNDEFDMTIEQIAVKLGKSRPVISNVMRLLQLPVEIQRALMDGKISEGHGRALLQVADRERQFALFNLIIEKKLTTDQAFAMSKEWSVRQHLRHDVKEKDPQVRAWEQMLQTKLNARRVSIEKKDNGGGKLEIMFLSDEEYNDILNKLNSL